MTWPLAESFVTWEVAFISEPSPGELATLRQRLEPIVSERRAASAGRVFREFGLVPWEFVGPVERLTAGEIALNCLRIGHRCGTGWRVMWPGFPKASPLGWSREDCFRAARPEALDGLVGWLADGEAFSRLTVPGLQSVSFQVTVIAAAGGDQIAR